MCSFFLTIVLLLSSSFTARSAASGLPRKRPRPSLEEYSDLQLFEILEHFAFMRRRLISLSQELGNDTLNVANIPVYDQFPGRSKQYITTTRRTSMNVDLSSTTSDSEGCTSDSDSLDSIDLWRDESDHNRTPKMPGNVVIDLTDSLESPVEVVKVASVSDRNKRSPGNEVRLHNGQRISSHELKRISSPDQLLDDTVIHAFIGLQAKESEFLYLDPQLLSVAPNRAINSVREALASKKKILWPISYAKHWTLAVLDPEQNQVMVYNSLNAYGVWPKDRLLRILNSASDAQGKPWTISWIKGLPQQPNEIDCGVFVCYFAKCILSHTPISRVFDASLFRRHIESTLDDSKL